MLMLKGSTGKEYQIEDSPFITQSDYDLYSLAGDSSKDVKLYHKQGVSNDIENKVRFLKEHQPEEALLPYLAWPTELVYREDSFCGYVMPRKRTTNLLSSVIDNTTGFPVSYRQKVLLGMTLCEVIEAVHNAGYVVGDLNPSSIGVNLRTGKIVLYSIDTIHISLESSNDNVSRFNSFSKEYTAPEILYKNSAPAAEYSENSEAAATNQQHDFSKSTDNYSLAVILFRLLMNGCHPFVSSGSTEENLAPSTDKEEVNKTIEYCLIGDSSSQDVNMPPKSVLTKEALALFSSAFVDGKLDPDARPTALLWKECLIDFEGRLKKCENDATHFYLESLDACPWCRLHGTKSQTPLHTGKKPTRIASTEKREIAPETNIQSEANVETGEGGAPLPPSPTPAKPPDTSSDGRAKGIIIGGLASLIGIFVLVGLINKGQESTGIESQNMPEAVEEVEEAEEAEEAEEVIDDVYVEEEDLVQRLIMNTTNLNVRSQPNTNSDIYTMIECGTLMNYVSYGDGWYEIEYDSGTAYVSGDYVVEVTYDDLYADRMGTVRATGDVNIRSGPGTNYERLGGLGVNQKAVFVGKSGDWYEILIHEGQHAYISASYATICYDWQ